jgi:hypothetical protein
MNGAAFQRSLGEGEGFSGSSAIRMFAAKPKVIKRDGFTAFLKTLPPRRGSAHHSG